MPRQQLTAAQRGLAERELALAEGLARRHRSSHTADEKRSDAYLGLLRAASRYDPNHGAPFRAFAAHHIRGALIDADRSERGRGQTAWWRRLEDARGTFTVQHDRAPSEKELAAELAMPLAAFRATAATYARQRAMRTPEHWDSHGPHDEHPTPLHEVVRDPEPTAEEAALSSAGDDDMEQIARLPPVARLAVTLVVYRDVPAYRVAALLGVSPSRVSQILRAAFERLALDLRGETRPTGR